MDLNTIIQVIAESGVKADMENFDDEKTFEQNGIDSLDTYTILLALEEKTGVGLEDASLEDVDSAQKLLAYIVANSM